MQRRRLHCQMTTGRLFHKPKVAAGTACSRIADVTLSFLTSNHVSYPFVVNGQWQKEKGESKGRQRQKRYREDATDTNSMGNRSSISDIGDGAGHSACCSPSPDCALLPTVLE